MGKDEINAFMGTDTNYQGKLVFKGTVRIDGDFDGEICSEGTLIIGQDARVKGNIKVGHLVLNGSLEGQIEARNKVVIYKQASLNGKITTPSLVVEEGAKIKGEVNMDGAEAEDK